MNRAPGALAATALVIASMVGTGVFTSLGFQLHAFSSGPQILLLWLVGGGVALCGALCYSAVARVLPRSGGEHHFLTAIYHPSLGFMAGVLSAIVGFAAPTALTALAFGAYLHAAVPAIPVRAAAAGVIVLGTAAHFFSSSTSARVQVAATALKLVLILLFLIAAMLLPGQGDIRWQPDPADDLAATVQPAFALSLLYVLYSYSGWNAAVYGLEEWRQPDRTIHRALIGGTVVVAVLYLALNAAFLHAAPVAKLRGNIEIGHIAAVSMFGEDAAGKISGLFAIGLFASVSALLWAGPRLLAAIGRTIPALSFFRPPPDGVPRAALLTQAGLALALVTLGEFESLMGYTQTGLTFCTMLTVAGLFVIRRDLPPGVFRRRAPAAVFFLAITGFVVVRAILAQPVATLAGFATVVAGTLLWFPLQRLLAK